MRRMPWKENTQSVTHVQTPHQLGMSQVTMRYTNIDSNSSAVIAGGQEEHHVSKQRDNNNNLDWYQ